MRCTSVLSCHETYTPKQWNFPHITRPFSIFYYVLGGKAFYEIDGAEHPFLKGHLYVLPVNRVYSLREDPRDKFYAVYIHAFTFPEVEEVIDLTVEKKGFLYRTLELLRQSLREEDEVAIKKAIEMMISYIAEISPVLSTPLHGRIKEHVERHFTEVFHHGGLSEQFNYSESYLTKRFKSEYHVTPKQYAGQLLLREITALLEGGGSVAKIAEQLHFSSPENLCRFFRAHYGCSPTEYKKRFSGFSM